MPLVESVLVHLLSATALLNDSTQTIQVTTRQAASELRAAAGALEAGTAQGTSDAEVDPAGALFADYLTAAASVLTGEKDMGQLDRRWVDVRAWPAVVVLTAALPGSEGVEGSPFTLDIGIPVADEQRWAGDLLDRMLEFERSLPLPNGYVPRGTYPDRILIADRVQRGGMNAGRHPSQTRLPGDAALRAELGSHWVFWRNSMRLRWYDRAIVPAIDAILVPEQQSLATAPAHLRFYATRFATYQIGPQDAVAPEGRPQSEEQLGELQAPLSIVKADLLGVLAHEWLIHEGMEPKEASSQNLVMLVVMSFVALADAEAGVAPPAHAPASRLVIERLREAGALTTGTGAGNWRVDVERARAAVRRLVQDVLAIQAIGDLAGAQRLFDRAGRPNAEIEATVRRTQGLRPAGKGP